MLHSVPVFASQHSKMEEHVDSAENVCFEGNVTFISWPTTVYGYRIIANGDIVKFWLEDR